MPRVGRERLAVRFQGTNESEWTVGQLARIESRLYFEYSEEWLERGLELSPFRLPAMRGPIEHKQLSFGPLFGLFDDSLPDGWGLLLMDRCFRSRGVPPEQLTVLDRLAYLGTRTMGALTYHPPEDQGPLDGGALDLGVLAREAEAVLSGSSGEVLPELLRLGGSPGGARPKVMVGFHPEHDALLSGIDDLPDGYEPWIVKFSGTGDSGESGPLEYAYSRMARAAGLEVPEARLFETPNGQRFFGVKRFDRALDGRRFHVHTLSGLIHANFRIPCCDYETLLKASFMLTRDRRALLASFRQAVFNVAAHNRDDHVKNFAFQLDVESGDWHLTPSYDLTFSMGPGGEHTTTVCGEGRQPGRTHLLELARRFDLAPRDAEAVLDEVTSAVSDWARHAREAGVARPESERVGKRLGLAG